MLMWECTYRDKRASPIQLFIILAETRDEARTKAVNKRAERPEPLWEQGGRWEIEPIEDGIFDATEYHW